MSHDKSVRACLCVSDGGYVDRDLGLLFVVVVVTAVAVGAVFVLLWVEVKTARFVHVLN